MKKALLVFFFIISAVLHGEESRSAQQQVAAQSVEALLSENGDFLLMTLDPTGGIGYAVNTDTVFHGFKILDQRKISEKELKVKLLRSLARGIRENTGMVAMCFNPRHGIRVNTRKGVCDIVICFECMQAQTYGLTNSNGFLVSRSPLVDFDSICSSLAMIQQKKEN